MRLAALDLQQLAHFDAFACRRGIDVRVLLQRAGKDANEAEFLHERVDASLEDLGDQRTGRVGLDFDFFASFFRGACDRVGRQAAHDQGVQQFGQADVRLGRAANDRHQAAFRNRADHQSRKLFVRGLSSFEIAFHHRFVDFDNRFDQRLADLVRVRSGRRR